MITPDPVEEKILRRPSPSRRWASRPRSASSSASSSARSPERFFSPAAPFPPGDRSPKRSLGRVLNREKPGALRAGILFYLLRLALLLGAFFLIICAFPDELLAFAAGLLDRHPGHRGRSGRGPRPVQGMEALEHPLAIVELFNKLFSRPIAALLALLGVRVKNPAHCIPDYVVMVLIVAAFMIARPSAWPPGSGAPSSPARSRASSSSSSSFFEGQLTTSSGPRAGSSCP